MIIPNEGARYIIENVFEGLDSAGEWYLDRKSGYIYYYLRKGEDPYHMEFYAPVNEKFLVLKGDPVSGNYVENISIENLEFRYTNYSFFRMEAPIMTRLPPKFRLPLACRAPETVPLKIVLYTISAIMPLKFSMVPLIIFSAITPSSIPEPGDSG